MSDNRLSAVQRTAAALTALALLGAYLLFIDRSMREADRVLAPAKVDSAAEQAVSMVKEASPSPAPKPQTTPAELPRLAAPAGLTEADEATVAAKGRAFLDGGRKTLEDLPALKGRAADTGAYLAYQETAEWLLMLYDRKREAWLGRLLRDGGALRLKTVDLGEVASRWPQRGVVVLDPGVEALARTAAGADWPEEARVYAFYTTAYAERVAGLVLMELERRGKSRDEVSHFSVDYVLKDGVPSVDFKEMHLNPRSASGR